MSAQSDAIERAAGEYIQARTALEAAPGARARLHVDRSFARLARLAAPQIRWLARRHGLAGHLDDAEQAGAIALHRAAERHDPDRARFVTFAHWQIRAELQALRQKLYGGTVAGAPLSLDALCDAGANDWLADPEALSATEGGASDRLADLCLQRLVADWRARRGTAIRDPETTRRDRKLEADRALLQRHFLDVDSIPARLCEADRHVLRRAIADMARHAKRL